MRAAIIAWIHLCRAVVADLGPTFLLAAVILPGGTLVALLWWLHRHRRPAPPARPRRDAGELIRPPASYIPAVARAKAWLGDRYLLAQPLYSTGVKRRERGDAQHA